MRIFLTRLFTACLFGISLLSLHAVETRAATLQTNSLGYVIGITSLEVDSATYDIDFVWDTWIGLGNANLYPDALAIASKASGFLTDEGVQWIIYDDVASTGSTEFRIPFNVSDNKVEAAGVYAQQVGWIWAIASPARFDDPRMWAVVTPSAVPLPAALPLFLSMLAGMGFLRWRRNKKAVV